MSNDVFPVLPGQDVHVTRKVLAPPVAIRTTPSRREYRARDATLPRYLYIVSWPVLRAGVEAEMQAVVGFFNKHGGDFDSFLFLDPDDNAVANQVFAAGNGVATAFQLVRTFGGFVEPISEVAGIPQVYRLDWQGQQLLYSTPRTNHLLRSEEMDNSAWTKTNLAVDTTNNLAPDGANTAERIQIAVDTSTSHTIVQNAPGIQAGTPQVGYIHARPDQVRYIRVHLSDSTGPSTHHCRAEFDLLTGAVSNPINTGEAAGAAGSVQGPFADGSYRCIVSGTPRVGSANGSRFEVYTLPSPGASAIYAGTIGAGFYAWGAQQSTVLGSYLKTTSAPVTVTDYTFASPGVVALPAPLAAGAQLLWTGDYYWRARFNRGELEVERFLRQLYEGKRVELITVLE